MMSYEFIEYTPSKGTLFFEGREIHMYVDLYFQLWDYWIDNYEMCGIEIKQLSLGYGSFMKVMNK